MVIIDPSATLESIRGLLDNGALSNLVRSLDEYLSTGGRLPVGWAYAGDAAVAPPPLPGREAEAVVVQQQIDSAYQVAITAIDAMASAQILREDALRQIGAARLKQRELAGIRDAAQEVLRERV